MSFWWITFSRELRMDGFKLCTFKMFMQFELYLNHKNLETLTYALNIIAQASSNTKK